MTEGEKEQRKLTANWLNIIAAGTVVTGTIGPLVAYILRIPGNSIDPYILGIGCASSVVVGGALHWLGRQLLRRL